MASSAAERASCLSPGLVSISKNVAPAPPPLRNWKLGTGRLLPVVECTYKGAGSAAALCQGLRRLLHLRLDFPPGKDAGSSDPPIVFGRGQACFKCQGTLILRARVCPGLEWWWWCTEIGCFSGVRSIQILSYEVAPHPRTRDPSAEGKRRFWESF